MLNCVHCCIYTNSELLVSLLITSYAVVFHKTFSVNSAYKFKTVL